MVLAIYGGGSLGKEILSLVRSQQTTDKWDDVIFIDDVCIDDNIEGFRKYSYSEYLECEEKYRKLVEIVIATGEPKYRKKLLDKLIEDGNSLGSVIYSNSYIGANSVIGEGTVVFPNAYISNDVKIGTNCIIHANAKIESGVCINDNSFVSSGAFIGADTVIGQGVFVGPNSTLFDHISIGNNSLVGLGSAVTKDVEEDVVVAGNPAKKIKDNNTGRVFTEEHCSVV